MSIITLILVLVLIGFLLWAIQTFIPMDAKIRVLIQAVVGIAIVLWLLDLTGIYRTGVRLR